MNGDYSDTTLSPMYCTYAYTYDYRVSTRFAPPATSKKIKDTLSPRLEALRWADIQASEMQAR